MMSPSTTPRTQGPSKIWTDYYGSVCLLLFILFIGAAFVWIKPGILHINEVNATIESRLQSLEGERGYANSLDQSIEAANSISAEILGQVQEALPTNSRTPTVLVQFQHAAEKNGVRLDNVVFDEGRVITASPTEKSVLPASVQPLEGTMNVHARNYFDVKKFLADVETSLRLIDVTGITAGGEGTDLTYAISFRLYTFTDQKTRPRP